MTKRKNDNAKKRATSVALSGAPALSAALVYQHFGLSYGETIGVFKRSGLTPMMSVPSGRGLTHYYEREAALTLMQAEVDRRRQQAVIPLAEIAPGPDTPEPCPPWAATMQKQMDSLIRLNADLTEKVDRLTMAWGLEEYTLVGEPS